MKFCMLTTFFGSHSFGGDSAYVDRLSRALARRGHEVHVIYCEDAFELVRGNFPIRNYTPPEGVTVHGLRSTWGAFSPLWTQQTGGPGPKWSMIQQLLEKIGPDVIHFHNLSLIGGPALLLKDFGNTPLFMTAHEHWLVCPMHVLWKSNDTLCERPTCHSCSIGHMRPPQFWRHSDLMNRALGKLDRLIMPSQTAANEHQKRGIERPIDTLPYFMPMDWPIAYRPASNQQVLDTNSRPYFSCVGRIEKIKGFQEVVALMNQLPEADLRIAGHGSYMNELKALAKPLKNIVFEGLLEGEPLRKLVRGARAMVVPSLVPETFGYVVLESFAQGRPVLGRNLGALPEILDRSGGGRTFNDQAQLLDTMKHYLSSPESADSEGMAGHRSIVTQYHESGHLSTYLSWVHASLKSRNKASSLADHFIENLDHFEHFNASDSELKRLSQPTKNQAA